jgi:hypothetical protein
MVLATTIFAIMSLIVMSIYIQTTSLTSRLKATRYLSETAREITERIAEDVKERGLSGSVSVPSTTNPYWDSTDGYKANGKEILGIGDGDIVYLYGKRSGASIDECSPLDKSDPKIYCGLYLVKGFNTSSPGYADAWNIVDSFVPEESRKRVKIEDMKFYVS